MNDVAFSKMTGLGNDFIFIDNTNGSYNSTLTDLIAYIPKLCKRGLSIGADGLVILEQSKDADFSWKFFNSDGSIAEMCGNAARCAAKFAYLNGIAGKQMSFETLAGLIRAEIIDNLLVKAELTKPNNITIDSSINIEGNNFYISSINTGVPHVIIFVNDLENINVQHLGSKIRYHEYFSPQGTNVNFCKVLNNNSIEIRTYERGVESETLACGTGALAAAVLSKEKKLVNYPVNVKTRGGGSIKISCENKGYYIEAEARLVYKGIFNSEAFIY
jgi:diaminopimelate epimerase